MIYVMIAPVCMMVGFLLGLWVGKLSNSKENPVEYGELRLVKQDRPDNMKARKYQTAEYKAAMREKLEWDRRKANAGFSKYS